MRAGGGPGARDARRPTVLVPRGGTWGERVAREARHRALEPLVVPLITDTDPADPAAFAAAVDALAAGTYAWIVVTSATAVRRVAERLSGLPAGTRLAAVGHATAAACTDAGWRVDLVPAAASAADLAAMVPGTAGRVLFPRSAIAAPTLVAGLRARGLDVDDVEAYRTVGTGTGPVVVPRPPDAVLVTSGSVAGEVAARLVPLDRRTRLVCIGPGTAADARALGLPVHGVAAARTTASLLDAVVEVLAPLLDTQPGR
ncbi:uroporphyrinogen-III synthase [Curtobacterium sp. MCBD17_013]|uniref:uroporphyrinogen-III synthase n=1 Tax=Curtobacterium sp. MCBD17_013 TaxID=2175668 RepID=UPI000DA98862|nr:uroporphyrinogen-III synthase [Curtobacterium sp. MCBD17_013]PZF63040.1 uroporphyrinogen-III synthase [Curtobacterium sp. MCBD17_013]